uniref:UBAP2 n=1 Tax=Caenorhabditis tropicalis TaxID=1561998 RepID=A0A1I7TSV7_9PELO
MLFGRTLAPGGKPQAAEKDQDTSQPGPSGLRASQPSSAGEDEQNQRRLDNEAATREAEKRAPQIPATSRRASQESLGVSSISSLPGFLSPHGISAPAALVQEMMPKAVIMFFSYY